MSKNNIDDNMTVEDSLPLRDYIIAENVDTSNSKIILPDSVKNNMKHVLVARKLGPDVKYVKEGDILCVHPYDFMPNKVMLGDKHMLFSEQLVIAVKRSR